MLLETRHCCRNGRHLPPNATVAVQDPAQRPSAAVLQQDPFVRDAAIPGSLPRRMAEHVASQRPVRPSHPPALTLASLNTAGAHLVVKWLQVSCMRRHQQHECDALFSGERRAPRQVPATRRKGNAEAQLTLPKWEFSCGEDGGTMKAARNARTLKSHHIASLDAAEGTLRTGATQRRSLLQPNYMVSLAPLEVHPTKCAHVSEMQAF